MSKKRRYIAEFNPEAEYSRVIHQLNGKYFNLFLSNYKWKGLTYRQENYIMKELYARGTIAAFNIELADELGFAPWARASWDMYGEPETVTLVHTYAQDAKLIPYDVQRVDEQVVIGYLQANRRPLKEVVDWYIARIAQVEMVINTNLQLHKMPFLIPVEDEQTANKVEEIIDRILNNEIVITATGIDPVVFKAIATQAEFIIDKLKNYQIGLENELKTILGINNKGQEKIEQLQLSEVNANNDEINQNDSMYERYLKDFCKRVKEVLNKDIDVEVVRPKVEHDGQVHNNEEKPGPKENEDE